MNILFLKFLAVAAIFSGWSWFMFNAGVNDCKADFEKAGEKQFSATLDDKQKELDAAIAKQNEWRAKVDELQKRKPPVVKHEKQNIENNNSDCAVIDGFGVFWFKLQERQPATSTESD